MDDWRVVLPRNAIGLVIPRSWLTRATPTPTLKGQPVGQLAACSHNLTHSTPLYYYSTTTYYLNYTMGLFDKVEGFVRRLKPLTVVGFPTLELLPVG